MPPPVAHDDRIILHGVFRDVTRNRTRKFWSTHELRAARILALGKGSHSAEQNYLILRASIARNHGVYRLNREMLRAQFAGFM